MVAIFALHSAVVVFLKHRSVKLEKRISNLSKTISQRNKPSLILCNKENGSQRVRTKEYLKLSHVGPT